MCKNLNLVPPGFEVIALACCEEVHDIGAQPRGPSLPIYFSGLG